MIWSLCKSVRATSMYTERSVLTAEQHSTNNDAIIMVDHPESLELLKGFQTPYPSDKIGI